MFTGIIQRCGRVEASQAIPGGRRLRIDVGELAADCVAGASLAVNGVCLTASHISGPSITFDVIQETLRRSNLGDLRPGSLVNLEPSLRPGDRMDGHFVQGHVDGQGVIRKREDSVAEFVLWIEPDEALRRYVIPKGSIAIDGVSLTVASWEPRQFSVALIPTTLERTNLKQRRVGDRVNLESDILVRTVVHTLTQTRIATSVPKPDIRTELLS